MNQNVKIADIISKLNETDELLKNFNNGNFSTIDKDLLLEKIRNIYETVLHISFDSKAKEVSQKVKVQLVKEKPIKEEKVTESVTIEASSNDTIIDFSVESEETQNTNAEEKKQVNSYPTLFEVETTVPQPEPVTVNKEKTKKPSQVSSSKTISDQYREGTTKTVSDLISKSQNNKDISSKQQLKPIKNIKTAISINDRIMFTKEIFDNDTDFYNEVVDNLNGMNSLDEAMAYLDVNIDINEDSEAIIKFVELVSRRFA
jgi:hypothetical protein